ncbi:hypothetical protein [Rubrivivax gelatinosus]|uniref:hypothetical protein n=1 Tax=Rubrivivax gelatinosus TaxID=28068 RepID=UPI0019042532|nr:hypothetical protein [Rubrivivax gelatinosus]
MKKPELSIERRDHPEQYYGCWLSCHGYESRSVAHLDMLEFNAQRRVSLGFNFPAASEDNEASKRVALARRRLGEAGYETPVVDDVAFEAIVRSELSKLTELSGQSVAADISSMSRSRIAALVISFFEHSRHKSPRYLDLFYFPASFDSHKHDFEPLESFGPCHAYLSGWPADPDLPLAAVMGLGTEPRRADGVVEMLEPDILALYLPQGDQAEYTVELQKENRRVLSVGGEPSYYSLRDPESLYLSLLATGERLAERSRLIFVPLGPKLFSALCVTAALSIGPEVGVWKASSGRGVGLVDAQALGDPIIVRITSSVLG